VEIIITNRIYLGEKRFRDMAAPNAHEAIIDLEQFELARHILGKRSARSASAQQVHPPWREEGSRRDLERRGPRARPPRRRGGRRQDETCWGCGRARSPSSPLNDPEPTPTNKHHPQVRTIAREPRRLDLETLSPPLFHALVQWREQVVGGELGRSGHHQPFRHAVRYEAVIHIAAINEWLRSL